MKINEIVIDPISGEAATTDNTNNPVVIRMKKNLGELTVYLRHYCQRYLTMIGGLENALFNHPLYRGIRQEDLVSMNISQQEPFNTFNIRKDRLPMDTPKNVSITIDDWFEKHTGVRFRSQSLFCSGNWSLAGGYGTNVVIVPIGDFDYCWSKQFRDMYEAMENYADSALESTDDEHALQAMNTKDKIRAAFDYFGNVEYFMENANYQFDKDLLTGVQSGNEIMVAGSKAVAISSHWLLETKYHYENEGWKL